MCRVAPRSSARDPPKESAPIGQAAGQPALTGASHGRRAATPRAWAETPQGAQGQPSGTRTRAPCLRVPDSAPGRIRTARPRGRLAAPGTLPPRRTRATLGPGPHQLP